MVLPSSELGYYERRAGRRRTSGWCTWSRAFSESGPVEAGRQPARRRRPAPLHGQFSQAHLPHLPAHEGERSTQCEATQRDGRGRQATHRMVIDAPSSSSDQQRVKVVERSHRRQSSAAQKAAGEVRVVAARPRLARVARGRNFRRLRPFTLPYLTLPYPTLGGCQPHCKWVYTRWAGFAPCQTSAFQSLPDHGASVEAAASADAEPATH